MLKKATTELDKILAYIQAGYAPSEIDEELNCWKGYTHDVWVSFWLAEDYGALHKPSPAPAITPHKQARKVIKKPRRLNVRHIHCTRAEACNA